jgi:hypothetical protein
MDTRDHGSAGDPMRDTSNGGDHARLNDAPGVADPGAQPGAGFSPELVERARAVGLREVTREGGRAHWVRGDLSVVFPFGSRWHWCCDPDPDAMGTRVDSLPSALLAAVEWLEARELEALREEARGKGLVKQGERGPWARDGIWVAWKPARPDGAWLWCTESIPFRRVTQTAPSEAAALRAVLAALASSPTAPATTAQAQPAPAEEPAAGRGEARPPTEHRVKCWPEPFAAVVSGAKLYEIRVNDRDYRVGDVLWLEEWSPETATYTGDFWKKTITYMTPGGAWGLPDGLCVLGLAPDPRDARIAELEASLSGYQRVVLDVQEAIEQTDLDASRPITDRVREIVERMKAARAALEESRAREADSDSDARRAWAADDEVCAFLGHLGFDSGSTLDRVRALALAPRLSPGPRWVTRPDEPGAAYLLVGDQLLAWEEEPEGDAKQSGGILWATAEPSLRLYGGSREMRRRVLETVAAGVGGESARAAAK